MPPRARKTTPAAAKGPLDDQQSAKNQVGDPEPEEAASTADAEAPCREHFPGGWDAVDPGYAAIACEHGGWTRYTVTAGK